MKMHTAAEMLMLRRRRLGLSQKALAQQVGLSLKTVQRIEGSHPQVSPRNVRKLAVALGLPLASLRVNRMIWNREAQGEELSEEELGLYALFQMQALAKTFSGKNPEDTDPEPVSGEGVDRDKDL